MAIQKPRPQEGAVTICDLMSRDHRRLDCLFMEADQAVRDGRKRAVALIRHYVAALETHIRVEEELLIPRCSGIGRADIDRPMHIMQREHVAILRQGAILAGLVTKHHAPDLEEVSVWMALLAVALATHELREETLVFPEWDRMIAQDSGKAAVLPRLVARVAPGQRGHMVPCIGSGRWLSIVHSATP